MRRVILAALLGALVLPVMAGVAGATPQGKTTICHRTASDKNPYVLITINNSALPAHIGPDAHPAKNGREDYVASAAEVEQGFCGEVPPNPDRTARYRIVRRMHFLVKKFSLVAGLGVSISCSKDFYSVEFSDGTTKYVRVGESRKGSIIRVRQGALLLAKVRQREVC